MNTEPAPIALRVYVKIIELSARSDRVVW